MNVKSYILTEIDEYTWGWLALHVEYGLKSDDVMDVLSDLFIIHGVLNRIRSDNGSEFAAKSIKI